MQCAVVFSVYIHCHTFSSNFTTAFDCLIMAFARLFFSNLNYMSCSSCLMRMGCKNWISDSIHLLKIPSCKVSVILQIFCHRGRKEGETDKGPCPIKKKNAWNLFPRQQSGRMFLPRNETCWSLFVQRLSGKIECIFGRIQIHVCWRVREIQSAKSKKYMLKN